MLSPEYMPAMDRRALLRSAILLVGGSMAGVPADAFAKAAAGAPKFFSVAQLAVVDAFAEAVIPRTDTPGARDAGVPANLDALMANWASAEHKAQFKTVVDEMDRAALSRDRASLPRLSPAKQAEFVTWYDTEKFIAEDAMYRRFKELVLTLYYLSEPGATQELRYELTPGKWEPSMPVTPDTRGWAV
ncbi:MAG TPA: gluconate 2-dehydrogenase subunit 3 family protein [Allosphingosinicella sp.]